MQHHCKALRFKQVMIDIVSAVNFVRSRELNHRQFQAFLDEMEREYGDFFTTEKLVRLEKGKVLLCLLSLSEDIKFFLIEKGQSVSHFENETWVYDLAFLTGSCGHLNELNSKLQGNFNL
jgi:hypothetical protein